ncbi:MAG: glycosyltransferase [Acidimicrobiia bacterium]
MSLSFFLRVVPRPIRRLIRRVPGAATLVRRLTATPKGPPSAPGSLRPVVYLPTWERWGSMRQRPQYLVDALARAGHPAYFVDRSVRRSQVVDGVTVVPSLRHVPGAHPILYVHFAPLRDLMGRFTAPVVIYDILDDLSIYDEGEVGLPGRHRVRTHHRPLIEEAAAVIASSAALVERHRGERPDLLLVENGVDVERFSTPRPRPSDLPSGQPVIGYHGAIARWFDFALLESVAAANPGWEFVLVGPVLAEVAAEAARVGQADNVHFLGERTSDDVIGYVQAFDVGVVWFVVNHLTEAVSPLKLFEYLAADTPAVSTPLPAAAVPTVRVADTATAISSAIREALDTADEEAPERRAAAADADWSRRVAPLVAHLDEAALRTVPE